MAQRNHLRNPPEHHTNQKIKVQTLDLRRKQRDEGLSFLTALTNQHPEVGTYLACLKSCL
jgi:hypothetical protein